MPGGLGWQERDTDISPKSFPQQSGVENEKLENLPFQIVANPESKFKLIGNTSMKASNNDTCGVWTVSQAKTHLSEVLRRAEEEGPQQIGKRRPFIVVPARQWYASQQPRKPMGKWLVDNVPQGMNLDIHFDRKTGREITFESGETE